MPAKGWVQVEDYDGEFSQMRVNLQGIGPCAGTSTYDTVTQDLDEIKDAVIPVILGEVRNTGITASFPESQTEVTDKSAQRESKWLVVMRDTTQYLDGANAIENPGYLEFFRFEIPTADLSKLESDHDDRMDTSTGSVGEALVSSLEANARSPWNHAAEAGVTPTQEVIKIVHVGRRS